MNASERIGFIGSSDAAAILGLSRWKTPLQVWAEKTEQVVPKNISDKEAIILGTELEDYVARRFMRITGKKVSRVNEIQQHSKYSFLKASLDRRVVGEDALLECKTASAWKAKEWEGNDIPQEYIVQVMHQLAVTGKALGYIAVLIGNQDFKWKEIKRDDKVISEMVSREVSFWNDFIVPKVMPAVISCKDSELLYALFEKTVPDSVLALGDEANLIAENIQSLQRDKESLEGSIEQKKNLLKVMLGENEIGISNLYKITWKTQETGRLNTKTLKDEMPDIYQKYLEKTKTRVLRIAKNKGDE